MQPHEWYPDTLFFHSLIFNSLNIQIRINTLSSEKSKSTTQKAKTSTQDTKKMQDVENHEFHSSCTAI